MTVAPSFHPDRAAARTVLLMVGLTVALVVLMLVSVSLGYTGISVVDVARAVFGIGDEKAVIIVQQLRLPRTLLAVLIGAGLGTSGAVLQGLLRNPLAEPGVLGVSTSASLGAVVVIYFSLSAAFPLALPIGAMLGAAVATGVLYLLAARQVGTLTLVLSGAAISGLSIALISLAMNMSSNPWAISEIAFWLMGSVRDRTFHEVQIAAPFIALGILLLAVTGRALDGLALGEDAARSLGVDVTRVRLLAIVGTSLATGAGVAVGGSVGFIGLMVPHLLRPVVGYIPSRLVLPSALGGAVLTLVADLAVRLLSRGTELHLGVLTSLIGTPFFFFLILRLRRQMQ